MKNYLLTFFLFNFLIMNPAFSQDDKFIKTSDGVIHYLTYGKGTPLLIINGGPGLGCKGFSPLAELLSDKYMTILFDQRGTGKSELKKLDTDTITMDLMAKDIETLRCHLKIKKMDCAWTFV